MPSLQKLSKKLQVAVLGGGGRESTYVNMLLGDKNVTKIHFLKANAGFLDNHRVKNVEIDLHNLPAITKYCKKNKVTLALCGSEDLAASGVNDALSKAGIAVFGASSQAVKIESDKAWARQFMSLLSIPQPRYEVFTNAHKALRKATADKTMRIVKASGLAGGKGVYVCETLAETKLAIKEIMVDEKFGAAGRTIVLEERLGWHDPTAEEASMMFYTDGKTLAPLPLARDHKREFDDDQGKNTGGMGAICPSSLLNKTEQKFVQTQIAQKIVDQLAKQKTPFTGILYVSVMKTAEKSRNKYGLFVIEINGRGGDPETEVQLLGQTNRHPSQIFLACTNGTLAKHQPTFNNAHYCDVVLCSSQYPAGKSSGEVITGINKAEKMGARVLHAGTKVVNGEVVTDGGRILNIVAKAKTMSAARKKAYAAAAQILFNGQKPKYRMDIGKK